MAYINPKRNKRNHESDSDYSSDESVPSWPRFLVMEGTDNDNSLKKLSPFAVSKGILGIAGEPKSVKVISQGLLIEVSKKTHSDNLLKCTEIAFVPVKVTPHKTLNSRKGVIRCRELSDMQEEDIKTELASQKVTYVKRVFIDKGRKATNTYILTFETTELPRSIKVGYLNVKVAQYIPSPLRCFRCQRYGHGSNRCTREERCSKCAGSHCVDTCTVTELCCANCTEDKDHAASDKKCPAYIKEQLVQKIKHTENISFPEARKRLESTTATSTSYANIVKTSATISLTSTAVQTDLTWPDDKQSPSCIASEEESTSTQTDTQELIPLTSGSVKQVEKRPTRQAVRKSKGEFGRKVTPPKDSVTTSNKFAELERMDTQEVHDTPAHARSRTHSPIKPP